jgi:predicted 3-demethylubiquinone-9 3-methyltransferase (glyoxalase superfamily)
MKIQQKITPFLSFNTCAEEAAEFYVSLIPDSKIVRATRNPANDSVMTIEFVLGGVQFIALNAGQQWDFTNAFSLSVACESQAEIDRLWHGLGAGGKELHCGWLTDKYGMAWQIVPANIADLLSGTDPAKSGRVMEALFQMVKLDMAKLQQAHDAD